MRTVLAGLLWSKSVKLTPSWRSEIRSAIKHAPFPSDKITIDGETFKGYEDRLTVDEFAHLVEILDATVSRSVRVRKAKKKRRVR